MCNLKTTIHTCQHSGQPIRLSTCPRIIFSGSAIGCKSSTTTGTVYLTTPCKLCAVRSETDEQAKLYASQQKRRRRNTTRRKVQVSGHAKLSILALMSPKLKTKMHVKLETILESDKEYTDDDQKPLVASLKKEAELETASSESGSSSVSSTEYGHASTTTLNVVKAVDVDTGVNDESADETASDYRSSIGSISSLATFGFAAAVPYQLVRAEQIEIPSRT